MPEPSHPAQDLKPRLHAALAALGLDAEPSQHERILVFLNLLQRWNSVHNLSATRDVTGLLQQHVFDCLTIVKPMARYADGRRLKVLDAGSGAGLPAVLLAIMRPDWTVTAVDSVGKKIAFLRQACGELSLPNLRPQHARLEALKSGEGRFDVITSRAFSSLRRFVETTREQIDPTGVWIAMKGVEPTAEIGDLPADCQMFHVEPLIVPGLHAERCLVWIRPVPKTH